MVTKVADLATTVVGLTLVPRLVEGNPAAAAVFARFGLGPGAVILGLASICLVVGVTEVAARLCADVHDVDRASSRFDGTRLRPPGMVRLVGYGPPSLIFGAAAVHNLLLLAGYPPFI